MSVTGFPFLFALFSLGHAGFTAQCFTTRFNSAISNSDPVAELYEYNLSDCLNYCILNAARAGDGCSSVVYHKEYRSCQVYGHDGTLGGAQIVSVNNHDYYNRTSYIGACQDRVVPKRGYQQRPRQYSVHTVKEPFPDLPTILVNSKDSLEQSKEALSVIESAHPIRKLSAEDLESLRLKHLTDILDEENEVPVEDTITFYNPTKTNICTKKEVVSYFVLFGKSLSAAVHPSRIRGIDQSSCIMYCSQNINSTGLKVPCYAANYDPGKEECRLYDRNAKVDRHSAKLADDKKIIFADKFCIETKKDCSADSPYIVYLNKQMTKKIVAHHPDVHSIVACMAFCIDNGECKAITYKIGGLCILHGLSPAVDPKLLVDGTEKTLVVENGCQTSARAVPSLLSGAMERMGPGGSTEDRPDEEVPASNWGEWSGCQFGSVGSRMRSRTRECYSDDCQDLQMQPCE